LDGKIRNSALASDRRKLDRGRRVDEDADDSVLPNFTGGLGVSDKLWNIGSITELAAPYLVGEGLL